MRESRITTGIRVGSVAAAATIGAVIGLGLRHGLAFRPFATTGRALLDRLGMSGASSFTVLVGVLVVACAVIVLGVCFTVVAAPLRGAPLLAVAILFGVIAWAVSGFVVASILTLSSGTVLGSAQRMFIFALMSLALVAGMRLARPGSRID